MRPEKGDPILTPKQQTKYRSVVGTLLYLVKHSRPDISNPVRELTKVLDGATLTHWKAMIRVIKYVIDTKILPLKLEHNFSKDNKILVEAYSDSEFAGDRETRASVYGFVIFVCDAPISWKSRSNKSVTLSSIKAEYYGASETAKEIFVKNIIESINELTCLQLPIALRMDNTGAIYLENNQTTGQRTKHIYIRVHHV
jgi:antitoxin component of RelBE/YafQ-DinJ toxin-antitoxin module